MGSRSFYKTNVNSSNSFEWRCNIRTNVRMYVSPVAFDNLEQFEVTRPTHAMKHLFESSYTEPIQMSHFSNSQIQKFFAILENILRWKSLGTSQCLFKRSSLLRVKTNLSKSHNVHRYPGGFSTYLTPLISARVPTIVTRYR